MKTILTILAVAIIVVFLGKVLSHEKPKGNILPDGASIYVPESDTQNRIDPWCLEHECKG